MKQRREQKLQEMNAKGWLIYRSGGKRFESIRKPTDWLIIGDLSFLFFSGKKRGRLGRRDFNNIYFLLFSAVIISPAWYDSRYDMIFRSSSLIVNNLARSQARYMIFVSILRREIFLLLKNAKKKKTPASISFILYYYYGRLICQAETVKLQWDDDEL